MMTLLNFSSFVFFQVACWNSYVGFPSCLKWAPRRAMFVTASEALAFWIPNDKGAETADGETNSGL